MKPTFEQIKIINNNSNMVINACAGSGKTSTNIMYASQRPNERILYLAFNKSIKEEAKQKFKNYKLKNVDVFTAHGLAYKFLKKDNVTINRSLKTQDIINHLGLTAKNQNTLYLVVDLSYKAFVYFLNSAHDDINSFPINEVLSKEATGEYEPIIRKICVRLWNKMYTNKMPIIDDFYLKVFQLKFRKDLGYSYIMLDEAQDSSPVMLDFIETQSSVKILTGDKSQAIYGFRHAINSMSKFPTYDKMVLSQSFRFGSKIANISNEILGWKKYLGSDFGFIKVNGVGGSNRLDTTCYISRSNAGVLDSAINHLRERSNGGIYFEGGHTGYAFFNNSSSLFDVLNIMCKKYSKIKNPLLKGVRSINELKDISKLVQDNELKTNINIALSKGTSIYGMIKQLRESIVKRGEAKFFFSTVHKSKGLEYDKVIVNSDFITFEDILDKGRNNGLSLSEKNEEINMLYVAVTRAKNEIERK